LTVWQYIAPISAAALVVASWIDQRATAARIEAELGEIIERLEWLEGRD
jgi:predicted acyl esterase